MKSLLTCLAALALAAALCAGVASAATPGPSDGGYAIVTDVLGGGGGGASGGAYQHRGCIAQVIVGTSSGAGGEEARHGYLPQVVPTLKVISITPTSGRMGGHKPPDFPVTVTVTGAGFVNGATVAFVSDWASRPATNVVVVDAATIICETPSQIAGPADVTVTIPGPLSATLPDAHTYTGSEGDIGPRDTLGDDDLKASDLSQQRRFVAGLDVADPGAEFQRADVAPRDPDRGGEGLTAADLSQQRRYAAGLDPFTGAAGPWNH